MVHNWVVFNLVDGLIRVVFFLAYILLISRMEDIRRVFQYHGAEHKVVHTWEAREELTVDNARRKTTLHPRCGTSFLLFVMVVSIIVFSLVKLQAFWAIFLSRVVLIPLISGLSYELIRLSAPRCQRGFFRIVVMPGLALQKITTKEPSDDQLAVAIHALKEALELDSAKVREEQAAKTCAPPVAWTPRTLQGPYPPVGCVPCSSCFDPAEPARGHRSDRFRRFSPARPRHLGFRVNC